MEDNKWISSSDLAVRWGFHINTLGRWRKSGFGPTPYLRGRRSYFYLKSDVDEFESDNPAFFGGN